MVYFSAVKENIFFKNVVLNEKSHSVYILFLALVGFALFIMATFVNRVWL